MKIFPIPFSIANEVVKRSTSDNRRLLESPVRGGNNLFYLGTPTQFLNKFNNPLLGELIRIQSLCENKFSNQDINPRTLQKEEGIRVNHKIKKSILFSLIPFIESYLEQFGVLYHNANFDKTLITNKINAISGDDINFFSDLVFIRDTNWAKPYFKWFNYQETHSNFKLIQEFLIPHQSFLNFEYESFENGIIQIKWDLSYTMSVINTSDNVDAIFSKTTEQLPLSEEDIETIRDAITKIRIGQSQFRNDILSSENNSCIFTNIDDPKLLIASHIKPWKVSSNRERRDFHNGLLLTPTFDKLFDRFLITFDIDGALIWSSNRLSDNIIAILNRGIIAPLRRMEINDNNRAYFEFHRNKFQELEENNN